MLRKSILFSVLVILAIRLWPATPVSAADFPAGMRAATFSMWWYDLGSAAVRGLDGVYSDTKLLRRSPFGEWVTVYFDPKKHTEKQLLARIRATRCPRAQHVTAPGIRTPFVAAGDVVQLETSSTITSIEAPEGWKAVPGTANIQLPTNAKTATFTAHLADGKKLSAKVNVVSRIGR